MKRYSILIVLVISLFILPQSVMAERGGISIGGPTDPVPLMLSGSGTQHGEHSPTDEELVPILMVLIPIAMIFMGTIFTMLYAIDEGFGKEQRSKEDQI